LCWAGAKQVWGARGDKVDVVDMVDAVDIVDMVDAVDMVDCMTDIAVYPEQVLEAPKGTAKLEKSVAPLQALSLSKCQCRMEERI